MSAAHETTIRSSDFPACKEIHCILPDDGTAKRLLVELRQKKGVIRAGTFTLRGIGALVLAEAKAKRGKLPESDLVRQVSVICSEEQADEVFSYLFWSANIDKPRRGVVWQQPLTACTPYELPADIPDEKTGD